MLAQRKRNHKLIVNNNIEYYIVDGLDVLQNEMLRLLKIINEISIKNGINYWIDGGSLIGVIRHGGFIPWDDDLDISLLKADYIRLVECLTDYSRNYDDACLFFDAPQQNHTCNFFASKHIFFRTEGSPMLIPAKVDIRPVNSIEDSVESLKENNIFRDQANILLFGKSYGYAHNIPKTDKEVADFFYTYNNEYGVCNAIGDDTLLVHPYFEFSSQFKLKFSDLFPLSYHFFNDIKVPIPCNYHYLQTQLYGDYMSLPALEHRAPVACKVYEKKLEPSLYKKYIKCGFGYMRKTIMHKVYLNLLFIRTIGLMEYIKIKIYE